MDERSIFMAALERESPPERSAYLDEACGGDTALRQRVDALLASHEQAGSFLRVPAPERLAAKVAAPAPLQGTGAGEPAAQEPVRPLPEGPGSRIGPYKLLQQLGEGGMGTVFLAEQSAPVRRLVALKIIKPGMDSRQVIARFEAERQALALMDHPNIARVLDGGTTGGEPGGVSPGRPYFVMELVKGIPITRFCDEQRLTPRQRLELFVPVCQAVQHAHQKGIIHRDLKPSNVMVCLYDGRPVAKVIDFGVAKAAGQKLTERTIFTEIGQVVGTLEYMSPEQAELNQLDIDTRSDIYSLGVLLYELLTGSTPLDKKRLKSAAMLEVLRLIREEEPPRPSTRLAEARDTLPAISAQRQMEPARLTKLVRGELDWIVMKALEKDRSRRYETANGFAADVQRYLADEPVLACPPSGWYRLRKFARRNKPRLATAAFLGLALLVAVGGIGWAVRDRSAQAAEAERERSERQQRVATSVQLILDDVERLERDQKWGQALAAAERAEAAALTGGEADDATGERVRAVRRNLAFVARLDRIRQNRAAMLVQAEKILNNRVAARDYAQAFREYGVDVDAMSAPEAVARLQTRPALAVPIVAALDDWKDTRYLLGESESSWQRLVAIARGLDADPLRDRLRAAWGQKATPDLLAELRRLAESIEVGKPGPATVQALASTLGRVGLPDLATKMLQTGVAAHPADFWLNYNMGWDCHERRNDSDAIRYYAVVVSLRPDSAAAHDMLGALLMDHGNLDEAITRLRRAVELDENYARAHNNLALSLAQKGKPDEAIAHCKKAIALASDYARAQATLGFALMRLGKADEAIVALRRAIDLDAKDPHAHDNLGFLLCNHKHDYPAAVAEFRKAIALDPDEAVHHYSLGNVLETEKDYDGAIASYQKALTLKTTDRNWKPIKAHLRLGALLCDQRHDYDGAAAQFRKAIALDANHAKAHYFLGNALGGKGQVDDAIAAYRQAIRLEKNYAEAHCNLGLALARKGQFREALDNVRRGHELRTPDWSYPSAQWVRACERLVELDDKLAGIRAAKTTPASPGERIALAGVCSIKRLNRAAARFYEEAFAAEPKLANDPAVPNRYNAACAAALAGCGQGQDADELDAVERTRLRRQALAWLKADLEAWRRLLGQQPDMLHPIVAKQMRYWLADTDFAGVRGQAAIAKLPQAEQPAWQQLWSNVSNTLAEIQAKMPAKTKYN